jgi:hypothetical protein
MTEPPKRHPPWNADDDALLRQKLAARETASAVAVSMGRTVDSIRGRAQALGLRIVSRVRPWRTALSADAPRAKPGNACDPDA